MRNGSWFDDNHPDVIGWQGGQPQLTQEAAQPDPNGAAPLPQSYGNDNMGYPDNFPGGLQRGPQGPNKWDGQGGEVPRGGDVPGSGSAWMPGFASPWQRGSLGGYLGQAPLTQPAGQPGVGPAPGPSLIDNGAIQMPSTGMNGSMGSGLMQATGPQGLGGGQQVRMVGPTGQTALVPHFLVPHYARNGARVVG